MTVNHMMLTFFALMVALSPFTLKASVEIHLGEISPQNQDFQEKMQNGLQYFFDLVNRQCHLDISYRVDVLSPLELPFERFTFDGYPRQYRVNHEESYFTYFQHDLAKIFVHSPQSFKEKSIKIFSVPNLDGYCGYAFPPIQFKLGDEYPLNEKLTKKIEHTLLLNYEQGGCGNFNRIMAHELAHLFIQDNPPHQCKNDSGEMRPCDEENLLSVFRLVAPEYPFKKPGNHNPFGGNHGPEMGDPMAPKRMPSIGTSLTKDQCQAIKRTVQTLDDQQ